MSYQRYVLLEAHTQGRLEGQTDIVVVAVCTHLELNGSVTDLTASLCLTKSLAML